MNRPLNTITYEGFRIFNKDYKRFVQVIDNLLFAHFDKDGNHIRPFFCESQDESQKGIILEITANGIEINGEYSKWGEPNFESITKDWKGLLKKWIIESNENWILNKQ